MLLAKLMHEVSLSKLEKVMVKGPASVPTLKWGVVHGTWSKWKLALLKSGRIESFMDELNNRQNAESDGLRNFWCVVTDVYLNHAVILCVLVVCYVPVGSPNICWSKSCFLHFSQCFLQFNNSSICPIQRFVCYSTQPHFNKASFHFDHVGGLGGLYVHHSIAVWNHPIKFIKGE